MTTVKLSQIVNFANVEFLCAAANSQQLLRLDNIVSGKPAVAFFGRSNVGKSSLINTILQHKKMARTSQSPGCTRQINFFLVDKKIIFVDLPGYGYAKVSKQQMILWEELLQTYLSHTHNIKRLFLLLDSRRGVMDIDQQIIKFLGQEGVPFRIVLNKIDLLKKEDLEQTISNVQNTTSHSPLLFSSINKTGLSEIRQEIITTIESPNS